MCLTVQRLPKLQVGEEKRRDWWVMLSHKRLALVSPIRVPGSRLSKIQTWEAVERLSIQFNASSKHSADGRVRAAELLTGEEKSMHIATQATI